MRDVAEGAEEGAGTQTGLGSAGDGGGVEEVGKVALCGEEGCVALLGDGFVVVGDVWG